MKRLFISFIILFSVSCIYAQTVKIEKSTEFKEINKLVNKRITQYGESEILIVLDIDNTILTSYNELGSDVWYQWQTKKLSFEPDQDQKLSNKKLYGSAIGLLYELGTMELTDTLIPGYIKNWQDTGITVFALTSRSPNCRPATERELKKYCIEFSKSALKPYEEMLPVYYCYMPEEMSYINGIMMTSGMDKGRMLAHILQQTKRSFQAIVFVDDSEKNVKNVSKRFNNDDKTDFMIFHYTKIEEELKAKNGGKVLTKKQADKMADDWVKLNKELSKIFPGRIQKKEYKRNCNKQQ